MSSRMIRSPKSEGRTRSGSESWRGWKDMSDGRITLCIQACCRGVRQMKEGVLRNRGAGRRGVRGTGAFAGGRAVARESPFNEISKTRIMTTSPRRRWHIARFHPSPEGVIRSGRRAAKDGQRTRSSRRTRRATSVTSGCGCRAWDPAGRGAVQTSRRRDRS
jgi:hypothetical protein